MFFVGIFGIETKEKQIKGVSNFFCKSCNRENSGQLIKSYNYFHFFFLPVFKWNERYFILCNNCSSVYEISKEKGKRLETGEEDNITYWDLKEIKSYNKRKVCKLCNNEIEDSFLYCPYCGNKLE